MPVFVSKFPYPLKMEQTVNFIAYTLAPLVLIAILFLIYSFVQTPVRIYQSQKNKFDKILKEKDLELEKYNWANIDFEVAQFSIIGKSGWAFKVVNGKQYDISKINVEITNIRENEKSINKSGLYYLPYIDNQNGKIREKIVKSYNRVSSGIKSGESKYFVVTTHVKPNKISETHKFETFPDELSWKFPTKTQDILELTSGIGATVAKYYSKATEPPNPVLVIELCIRAEIKIENEIIQLPGELINLLVKNNGSLSFYNNEVEK